MELGKYPKMEFHFTPETGFHFQKEGEGVKQNYILL